MGSGSRALYNGITRLANVFVTGRTAFASTAQAARTEGFQHEAQGRAMTIIGYTGSAKNIVIPGRIGSVPVAVIGDRVFKKKQLASVTIPDSVTTIGCGAFMENYVISVTIPDNVTAIRDRAFSHDSLTSVTIPNGVTAIGDGAFCSNQLTSVTIPANVKVKTSTFFGHMANVYMNGCSHAGTYISGGGATWRRQ
jgi:hypothetical protein